MEMKWIFNATSSFNKLWNTKVVSKEPRVNKVFSRDDLSK